MGLRGWIIRRTIYMLVILFIIMVINFVIFRLMPGTPIDQIIGESAALARNPRLREQLEALFGLNRPLLEQFFYYLAATIRFDFGWSYADFRPVSDGIATRLPNTLLLLGSSTVLAIIIGVALGTIAAARRNSAVDGSIVTTGLLTNALPSFWIGLIFLTFFGFQLRLIPLGRTMSDPGTVAGDPISQVADLLWHLAAPMSVLTLISFGGFALVMRATLLEVLTEDYITTARAKGLDEHTVVFKHAMRNALLPIVTVVAISFGFILSGAIITETIFSWSGLGYWTFASVLIRDYPVLQAMFFIISLCVVVANFIADLIYGFLDPRIRR